MINVTHLRSVDLVRLIASCDAPNKSLGLCRAGAIATAQCEMIIFRQKAINVLAGRMRRHFRFDIIGLLQRLDIVFARTFCERHLHRQLEIQNEVQLSLI